MGPNLVITSRTSSTTKNSVDLVHWFWLRRFIVTRRILILAIIHLMRFPPLLIQIGLVRSRYPSATLGSDFLLFRIGVVFTDESLPFAIPKNQNKGEQQHIKWKGADHSDYHFVWRLCWSIWSASSVFTSIIACCASCWKPRFSNASLQSKLCQTSSKERAKTKKSRLPSHYPSLE